MQSLLLSLEPISADSPAGIDARLELEHELVRAEIAKLGSVDDERPDWTVITSKGLDLLRSRSKDLLIATYVVDAWSEASGLPGAAEGVRLLAELIARYGQQLFPQRSRARINAIEWFLERLTVKLDAAKVPAHGDLVDLREAVSALRATVSDLLGDQSPSFTALLNALARVELAAPARESEPAPQRAVRDPGESEAPSESRPAQVSVQSAEAIAALLAPLTPHPAGEDATYDDAHVAVRNEIQKLEGVHEVQPEWQLIVERAEEILGARSKDLSIAAYLTVAMLETRSLPGLRDGLKLCVGLIDRYWESMWPPLARVKRRTSALEWLLQQVVLRLSHRPSCAAALRSELVELTAALAAAVSERLSGTVDFSSLQAAIAHLPAGPESASPPPPSPNPSEERAAPSSAARSAVASHTVADTVRGESAHAGAATVAQPSSSRAGPFAVDDEAFGAPPQDPAQLHAYVLRTGALLVRLGQSRFEVDPTDARAYRWLRAGLWLRWEKAPAPNRRGRLEIDAPSTARRADLQKALREAAWPDVLAQSEALLARSPLWLEPHRLSVLAMERMGEVYQAARGAIEREARHFFARFPELAQLQFADGTPLGSPETLAWLAPATSAPSAAMEASERSASIPEPMREGLLRGDAAASAEFSLLLRGCSSRRASFHLRLELAALLQAAGRVEQASQLYLGLERELDSYRLDLWEPELALQVLEPLWRLLSATQSSGVAHAELPRICARLAQLAPTALL